MDNNKKDTIDLALVFKNLWLKKKVFFIVWAVVFALSSLWIFPEPRFYNCEVELAPEGTSEGTGGLVGLAATVGINLSDMATSDAIYPILYPDLFESPEFIVGLFDIKVTTADGSVSCDYYTYLKDKQKKNWLTEPFKKAKYQLKKLMENNSTQSMSTKDNRINSFMLSERDFGLVEKVKKNLTCSVDKKTNVITIVVKDQDRLVSAILADSIKSRLQNFIIDYRTKKVREDVKYYQHLADSTRRVYDQSVIAYGAYNDSHRNVTLQTYIEEGERLKNDMNLKLNTYNTFEAQLSAARAKVQERTPSFTTLKSATVPIQPAGPKRLLFIVAMLFIASIITTLILSKKALNTERP